MDPNAERDLNSNIYEKLAEKYGMSIEQAKANTQNMVQMAESVGLDFQMDTMILTNTFDAHRVTMFAKNQGLLHQMTDRILHAYYTESKHIGDHETLINLAEDVGLDRDAVAKLLESDDMSAEVRADEKEAAELGIRSIPFFLINKKYALTGAQPTETFVQSIQQIIEEDGPFTINEDGVVCDENGCEIPKP